MLLFLLFVFNYIRIFFRDHFDEWRIMLILMLPMRFFDQTKTFTIGFKERSKSIWFAKVAILLRGQLDVEYICGPQLMCLANERGEIPINTLKKYYPQMQTLVINYISTQPLLAEGSDDDSGSETETESNNISADVSDDSSSHHKDMFEGATFDDLILITKIIDIDTKKEINSGEKCFLGRIHL